MPTGQCDIWCRVKYLLDDNVKEVPLTFFQDWQKVAEEIRKDIVRESYEVFWSNQSEDTPEKVLERDGRILCIEKVTESMVSDPPTIGYYSASLLNFADSQKKLHELLKQRAGRRTLKPTQLQNTKLKSDLAKKRLENKKKAENQRAAVEYTKHVFEKTNSSSTNSNVPLCVRNPTEDQPGKLSQKVGNGPDAAANDQSQTSKVKENIEPRGKKRPCRDTKASKVIEGESTSSDESLVTGGDGNDDCVPLVQFKDKLKENEGLQVKENIEPRGKKRPHRETKASKVFEGETTSSDESLFTDGDGNDDSVPLVQFKDKVKEIEELKSKLKCNKDSHEALYKKLNKEWESKWEKALSEWKSRWDAAQEKIQELEKETENMDRLKKKIDDLESQVARYRDLNVWWQEQERLRKERSSSSRHSHHSKSHSHSSRTHISGNMSVPSTPTSIASPSLMRKSTSDVKKLKSTSAVALFATPPSKDQRASSRDDDLSKDLEGVNRLNEDQDVDHFIDNVTNEWNQMFLDRESNGSGTNVDDTVAEGKGKEGGENEEVAFGIRVNQVQPITMTQFNFCRKTGMGPTKRGESGDSMFCKNVLGVLMEKEALKSVSAAGRGATTGNVAARPEISLDIKTYISLLLDKRIYVEEPSCTKEDKIKRLKPSRINSYICSKIKAARRVINKQHKADDNN